MEKRALRTYNGLMHCEHLSAAADREVGVVARFEQAVGCVSITTLFILLAHIPRKKISNGWIDCAYGRDRNGHCSVAVK